MRWKEFEDNGAGPKRPDSRPLQLPVFRWDDAWMFEREERVCFKSSMRVLGCKPKVLKRKVECFLFLRTILVRDRPAPLFGKERAKVQKFLGDPMVFHDGRPPLEGQRFFAPYAELSNGAEVSSGDFLGRLPFAANVQAEFLAKLDALFFGERASRLGVHQNPEVFPHQISKDEIDARATGRRATTSTFFPRFCRWLKRGGGATRGGRRWIHSLGGADRLFALPDCGIVLLKLIVRDSNEVSLGQFSSWFETWKHAKEVLETRAKSLFRSGENPKWSSASRFWVSVWQTWRRAD